MNESPKQCYPALPEWVVPLSNTVAALVVYLLSRSASLDDFDSYSFALALDHFDPRLHQPQPPGYPVYVALGQLFYLLIRDARVTLTTLSAVGGAVAVGLVSWLGQAIFCEQGWPRRATTLTAASTAMLFALIPLQWLTAGKALSDAPGLALALGAMVLTWAGRKDDRLLVLSALAMGLSLGVRPQANLPGLLLLAGVTAGRVRTRRWRPLVLALIAGVLACGVWFIPTVIASGGLVTYRVLLSQTGDLVWNTDSLFGGGPVTAIRLRARVLEFLQTALMPTLGVNIYAPLGIGEIAKMAALVAFVVGGVVLADWRRRETWLLLGWLLLVTGQLFLFESLGRERRFIPLLPPLLLLVVGGWLRGGLLSQVPSPQIGKGRIFAWLRGGIVVIACAAMLASGWPLAHKLATIPAPHTQAVLAIREQWPAGDTLVVAAGSFRAAQVELPGYTLLYLYTWDNIQARSLIADSSPHAIAILDRDVFDPLMDTLSADDRYVPVFDATYTRDARLHLLASDVRLQVLVPVEALEPADLLLPENGIIDLGSGEDGRFVGAGWFRAEDIGGVRGRWAGSRDSSVLRMTLPPADYVVALRALAYPPSQQVTVRVNGTEVARFELAQGWAEYTFILEAGLLPAEGITTLELEHRARRSPYEETAGASSDQRELAAAYDWIKIVPGD